MYCCEQDDNAVGTGVDRAVGALLCEHSAQPLAAHGIDYNQTTSLERRRGRGVDWTAQTPCDMDRMSHREADGESLTSYNINRTAGTVQGLWNGGDWGTTVTPRTVSIAPGVKTAIIVNRWRGSGASADVWTAHREDSAGADGSDSGDGGESTSALPAVTSRRC